MSEISGGASVVSALKRLGVKMIFDLPGLHTMPIYDALYDESGIRRIMTKHENNASVMADVYGRLTGRPGVALEAAGPGATNSLSGVAQAMVASSPMLHISGTVPRAAAPYALHGLEDPGFLRNVFAPVTKWSVRVKRFESITSAMVEGYALAGEPRKGPVHVEVPFDLLRHKGEVAQEGHVTERRQGQAAAATELLTRFIESSESPLIYAGKTVARDGAVDEIVALAERLEAPVIINEFYPDAFPLNHRLFAGYVTEWAVAPVGEMALNATDLILAVGVQWGSEETQFLSRFSSKPCVHIDVDKGYPTRGHRPALRLIGNIKTIVSELVGSVAPRTSMKKGASLADQVSEVNAVHWKITKSIIRENQHAKPIYPGLVGAELAKVADSNAIVVLDGSSTSAWILDVYAKERSSMLMGPGAYGSIGFAFPASIAAKAVHPDRQVIAVIGDGGFLMSYMDMSTPLEYDLPITVIVTNNRTYGDIWHIQRRGYNARYIGTDLPSVNYAELARSFGAVGIRVEEPSMLGEACREALGSSRFTIIDVVTDVHYPFLEEVLQDRVAHTSKQSGAGITPLSP